MNTCNYKNFKIYEILSDLWKGSNKIFIYKKGWYINTPCQIDHSQEKPPLSNTFETKQP